MEQSTSRPTDYIYVPLRLDLYKELIRRHDRWNDTNPNNYIEYSVENFLDRTHGDPDIWTNEEYLEECAQEFANKERQQRYGDPKKGYFWKSLFLPNGTQLRMTYNGSDHCAEVCHQKILYQGETRAPEGNLFSPARLARHIAHNTSRNAWRDFYVKRPTDREWRSADFLRLVTQPKPVMRSSDDA